MNLEINLVKSPSIFAKSFELLDRKRTLVANDSEAISAIVEFIGDNMQIFEAALTDRSLVMRLQNLKTITIDELYALKFTLANSGLDILFYAVSDTESNANEIPEGIYEYSVVDNLNNQSNFIKFGMKLNVTANAYTLSDVYGNIIKTFGFFETPMFEGMRNPMTDQLSILRQTEEATGVAPVQITSYLNSILEYLGKDLILITN